MAKESLDPVAAFNALRTAARSRRTKIGVVAEHVLERGSLPAETTPDPPPRCMPGGRGVHGGMPEVTT